MKKAGLAALLLLWISADALAISFGDLEGYTTLSRVTGAVKSTTNMYYTTNTIICDTGCAYRLTGSHEIRWSRTGDVVAGGLSRRRPTTIAIRSPERAWRGSAIPRAAAASTKSPPAG